MVLFGPLIQGSFLQDLFGIRGGGLILRTGSFKLECRESKLAAASSAAAGTWLGGLGVYPADPRGASVTLRINLNTSSGCKRKM